MRMDEVMRFKVENVKEALLTAGDLGGAAMDRLNEVLPRERMSVAAEKAVDLPREWMKIAEEASLSLQNSAGEAMAWLDEVFPPETRKEKIEYWFNVALPYLIAAMVMAVVIWLCRSCSKFCLCAGRGSVKMMKAPGRALVKIPRAVFESDPRGYFINLRASP